MVKDIIQSLLFITEKHRTKYVGDQIKEEQALVSAHLGMEDVIYDLN